MKQPREIVDIPNDFEVESSPNVQFNELVNNAQPVDLNNLTEEEFYKYTQLIYAELQEASENSKVLITDYFELVKKGLSILLPNSGLVLAPISSAEGRFVGVFRPEVDVPHHMSIIPGVNKSDSNDKLSPYITTSKPEVSSRSEKEAEANTNIGFGHLGQVMILGLFFTGGIAAYNYYNPAPVEQADIEHGVKYIKVNGIMVPIQTPDTFIGGDPTPTNTPAATPTGESTPTPQVNVESFTEAEKELLVRLSKILEFKSSYSVKNVDVDGGVRVAEVDIESVTSTAIDQDIKNEDMVKLFELAYREYFLYGSESVLGKYISKHEIDIFRIFTANPEHKKRFGVSLNPELIKAMCDNNPKYIFNIVTSGYFTGSDLFNLANLKYQIYPTGRHTSLLIGCDAPEGSDGAEAVYTVSQENFPLSTEIGVEQVYIYTNDLPIQTLVDVEAKAANTSSMDIFKKFITRVFKEGLLLRPK